MKKILIVLLIVVLAALALPISNLIVGLPNNNALMALDADDAEAAKALAVLGRKCVNCHTSDYVLPFYAKLPVAKQMIEGDIREGTRFMNMLEAFAPSDKQPVSEVVLAKCEYTTLHDAMPPMRYLALHWNGALTDSEEQDILAWVKDIRKRFYATSGFPPEVQEGVLQPLPLNQEQDAEKAALGEKLFHDVRLSKDNTISCASCHGLDKGGTDREAFSKGVGGAVGDINAPTVFNSGFLFRQFWDGRAPTLEEQADGPVNNPKEMASNWPEAIAKLEQDAEFTAAFKAAYPEGYSKESITNGIAAFERTLVTPNSRFDKFLTGQYDALTADEKKGYQLFLDCGCATCHTGKALGGQSFEIMGRMGDYFKERGNARKPDFGRFNVTNDEEDRYAFKAPTLRNIALTPPYLHDSSTDDLHKVVKIMGRCQVGKKISDEDAELIGHFLQTLTGEYKGQALL